MRSVNSALLATCATMLSGLFASAQQQPAQTPTPTAAEAWAAYGTPGPEHAVLARRVGSWDVTVRAWSAPDASPRESKGRSEWQPLLGGRFFEERFEVTRPNGRYEARGLAGFDKIRKQYVSTWIDGGGTSILRSVGTADPTGKILTFSSESPDPVHGTVGTIRTVETEVDATTWTMEAFRPDQAGHEYRSAVFTYHRR
ncbi:MAG TPA: DUF1579 family protein [Thermoanaerobaculaceae bacterium]|nr:DUF1579 family protein [Thermoanaerobaculaceae bacterium]HPS79963.1 DUF1579 family protein [Thermoanaerobaculaceae bacterium]